MAFRDGDVTRRYLAPLLDRQRLGAAMPSDRPRIYARLDEDTLERWKAFVTYHGLSDAAFIEAIGRNLPEPSARLPPWLAAVVKDARKIRGYRGDRRPPD